MNNLIPPDGTAVALEGRLLAALTTLDPIITPEGERALPDTAVRQAVQTALAREALPEPDWATLLATGVLGRVLLKLGYSLEPTQVIGRYCTPVQAAPWLAVFAQQPEVAIPSPPPTLYLAQGLSVYAPIVVLDDDSLILLQMLGPPEAVNANWAALVGGGKSHWLKGRLVRLGGMKQYVRLKASLPCGWSETWLIHRQASLSQMTPGQPFYLLDDGHSPLLDKFFYLADKALPVPLLATWAEYLWLAGQQRSLVCMLDPQQAHGLAAWRIEPELAIWEAIVAAGLQQGLLSF